MENEAQNPSGVESESPLPAQEGRPIEANDKFYHKHRHSDMCRVEYVSVDGSVGYRILGTRHTRYSTEKNFRKNWTPIE